MPKAILASPFWVKAKPSDIVAAEAGVPGVFINIAGIPPPCIRR